MKYRKTKNGVEYVTWDDMKRQMFARPGFKEAYDALEPKYALIHAMLDARYKKGMTQAGIAKKAGTTQSAIARFESGRSNPTLDFAARLSRAVGAKLEITLAK